MARTIPHSSWQVFKQAIDRYSALPLTRRSQFIFRGQSNSQWALESSLDRIKSFTSSKERDDCFQSLRRQFIREASPLIPQGQIPRDNLEWDLLARHHGLPTPILDWTESPYIAAFFAFDNSIDSDSDSVSIWLLDRDAFQEDDIPQIQIIDNEDAIRFNPRAIEQRSLFLRIVDSQKPIDALFGDALVHFDIPKEQAKTALSDLDEMRLTSRTLFRDLDGAARSAKQRILFLGEN